MVTFFGQEDITLERCEESIAEVDYDQDEAISYDTNVNSNNYTTSLTFT